MKTTLLLLLSLLLFAACLTPEQQATAVVLVDELLRNGAITQSQHDVLMMTLGDGGGSGIGSSLLTQLMGYIATGVSTYLAVQARRGPVATSAERVARKRTVAP